MKLQVTFREKNKNFSKEYADQYEFGKESPDNTKDNFSKSFELSDEIDDFSFSNESDHHLVGKLENGLKIDLILDEMASLSCFKNGELFSKYSISKKLLEKTHKAHDEKRNISRFYFYLKPKMEYTFLGNNVCILKEEIPSEFFENKTNVKD